MPATPSLRALSPRPRMLARAASARQERAEQREAAHHLRLARREMRRHDGAERMGDDMGALDPPALSTRNVDCTKRSIESILRHDASARKPGRSKRSVVNARRREQRGPVFDVPAQAMDHEDGVAATPTAASISTAIRSTNCVTTSGSPVCS